MTTRDPLPPEDEADLLAAEYVLGVLPLNERVIAEARAKADAAFAARVQAWQERLAPMNHGFPEIPAPDLLPEIEARLFPTPRAQRPRRFAWRFFGGAVAAALLAAAVLLWQAGPTPLQPGLTADLAATDQSLRFQALVAPGSSTLTVRRIAGEAPGAGQDLQLWLIGTDGTPRPLGLLRGGETTVTLPAPAAGLTLAISLEPEGGSPTGLPTGPVLATGILGAG